LRGVGSRVLTLSLAACLVIGPALWSSAAAQQATPTPTPTPAEPQMVPVTELPGGVTITFSPTVAPAPTAIPLVVVPAGTCGGANQIFQDCSLYPAGTRDVVGRLEGQAITSVLQQYQLPDSERPRVLRDGRDAVRAALYAQVTDAFRKEPSARNADEQLVLEVFTRRVREKHVEAATVAQAEYNRWASNRCGYVPPPGFTYDVGTACASPLSSAFSAPASPGLQAFAAYGAAAAYKTAQDDPQAARVFGATSSDALLIHGYAAAVGLSAVGAAVGSTVPLTASAAATLIPYAQLGLSSGAVSGGEAGGHHPRRRHPRPTGGRAHGREELRCRSGHPE
jgi:hypothetical protein